jgi:hypothetical protein
MNSDVCSVGSELYSEHPVAALADAMIISRAALAGADSGCLGAIAACDAQLRDLGAGAIPVQPA